MEFYKAFDQFKLLHEICTCLFYPCYLLTLLYWIDKNLSKENPFMSEKENYISFTILFIPTFLVKIGCIVILGLKDNTTSHIHKILLSFYTGLIGVLMVLTLGILAYKKICHKFNSYKPMIHLFIISFTFMIYNLFYLFSTYTSQLPRIVHTVIYQALGPILLFLMLLLVYPIRNNLKQESKQDTSNATEMKKRIPPLKTETSINFGSETPRLHFEMGGEIGTPRGHFGIETPRNHAFSPETPREMEPLSASGRV
ncbi:hypothetical protein CYY_009486 [Polysphondylium violaceum]|uniref:Uncharacterized protein n=1 Tax=Polysphondylium violaceum TaxID=133409 RepID=A0A8J4UPG0_9MYCE|nr:hypothetical protein CYY_009486 [Polysphondylium violaceum]